MPKRTGALLGVAKAALMEERVEPADVAHPADVLPELDVVVAVDTEGSGLHVDDGARPSVIIVAWQDPDSGVVRSYPFPFDQGTEGKVGLRTARFDIGQGDLFSGEVNLGRADWDWLVDWLTRRQISFHNAKHDLHQLRIGHRIWKSGVDLADQTVWDTMIGGKELWPLDPLGLGAQCERLGIRSGAGGSKTDTADPVKSWLRHRNLPPGRYDLVPWDIIGPYAASDGELSISLYHRQRAELEERGEDARQMKRELEVMRVLYRMETRGLPYDSVGSMAAAELLRGAQSRIAAKLPFDPSKGSEVKRFYFGKREEGGLGHLPYSVTEKKGEPQLNEDVLRKMLKDDLPWAGELAEYNRLDTALSMWYEAYPSMAGPDGRLRTSFKQVFVRSGRFSVERFQAQALPHNHRLETGALKDVPTVRALVGAAVPAGQELWEVDLAQAELRVAAVMADCQRMLRMVAAGEDLHGVTATELFGVDKNSPDWFKYRQVAKRGNFSFIFGVGSETFRETVRKLLGVELSSQESEQIVRKWNGLYPEYRRTIYQVMDIAKQRSYKHNGVSWVNLINGRKRWFQPYEELHKAFNQVVQASLAELGKDWMVDTERRHPGVLLLTVHDSQYLQLPAGDEGERIAHECARRGAEIGTDMFGTPMACDVARWNTH